MGFHLRGKGVRDVLSAAELQLKFRNISRKGREENRKFVRTWRGGAMAGGISQSEMLLGTICTSCETFNDSSTMQSEYAVMVVDVRKARLGASEKN